MTDYELARPNEAKLLKRFDALGADWEKVALSLLSYMSDNAVGDWMRLNEYFDEDEEEEEE